MTRSRVLVTGGAGYIGSETVRLLLEEGHEVVVFDDLSTGHRKAVPEAASFIRGRISDTPLMIEALAGVDAVFHFAANIEVAESVTDPKPFWWNNFVGTLTLLDAMVKAEVFQLVFSSTAAVYGNPPSDLVTEKMPLQPVNPYGESKLSAETLIADYCTAYGLCATSLRYFNAAGAAVGGKHGADHAHKTHLVTLCLEAAARRLPCLTIFGTDYPTPDGTCVRDYIHVADLARAHLAALSAFERGIQGSFNLGNGKGHSVREVVECVQKVTGVDFPVKEVARRPGDPAYLVASSGKALDLLGWKPCFPSLEQIVHDAWEWVRTHPKGYGSDI